MVIDKALIEDIKSSTKDVYKRQSLKKTISQNFSIGSDSKMTLSENFGKNMNYLFK